MMTMMMVVVVMKGFVERVINSPQVRCQSTEQLACHYEQRQR